VDRDGRLAKRTVETVEMIQETGGEGMALEADLTRATDCKGMVSKSAVIGLTRAGTGWDIGAAVRFLLSEQARYITGQVLVVDGGTSLTAAERDTR
jgi:NAD(P)-dependent dehydrogenase (short-subunit alcohol dehydrogenase family)